MAASVWCEKEQKTAFSFWPPKQAGWVPSEPTAFDSQAFTRKDVLSPLNYQQSKNPVWYTRFSNLLQGTPPCERHEPAPCSLVQGGEENWGENGPQRSLLSFTTTPQARVGLAGRNICPGAGKEENFRADDHSLEVSGENGPPHNSDQPVDQLYRHLFQPCSPCCGSYNHLGLWGQLHCLPFWFILRITAKKSPKMCVWLPIPLYWMVYF